MKDAYEILGISRSATDDEVKEAYRALARKYHPDNYSDNPLSDLAKEKMQEINDAYDTVIRERRSGGFGGGTSYGSQQFNDVRSMINAGRIAEAETLLQGIPMGHRTAEWYYLMSRVLCAKGWFEEGYNHAATACRMEPMNAEYTSHKQRLDDQRRMGGSYMGSNRQGCSGCDVCTTLICADCCCECMGGDFIRCI